MESSFKGQHILVTGGAGFMGSNLTCSLVKLGAHVTVVDNFHPDYGGNEVSLAEVRDKIKLVRGDIVDRALMIELCRDADLVFHIAAQCSHVDSMIDPWLDIDYNCRGTLSVLEGVRHSPKKPGVVYAGTRAIIGAPLQMPALETTLPNPTDIYGVNKLAAEMYGAVYARVHGIAFVSLRLTNCFGPRHQMRHGKYGILNWFISLAMQGKTVKVFGTGEQTRDYLYIDDANEAFIQAAKFISRLKEKKETWPKVQNAGPKIPFAVFNISSGTSRKFVDCAKRVVQIAGTPFEMIPWPADRAAIETGDFAADTSAAHEILGWKPKYDFETGLDKTFAFYKENLKSYI